jgi:hypothetical protein
MLILADTNILIRVEITGHPDHVEAASAVRILRAAGHTFGMAAQKHPSSGTSAPDRPPPAGASG